MKNGTAQKIEANGQSLKKAIGAAIAQAMQFLETIGKPEMNNSHAHYEQLIFVEDTNLKLVAAITKHTIKHDGPEAFQPFTAYGRGTVAPQLWNLLQASPLMYQELTRQCGYVQVITEMLEANHIGRDNPLMALLEEMERSILLIQRTAQEGILKVSADLDNEMKRKATK